MKELELHIKGIVFIRCETIIKQVITKLNGKVLNIKPDHAVVEMPNDTEKETIAIRLKKHDFELLEDDDQLLIQQIKTATLDYLRHQEESVKQKQKLISLSKVISKSIGRDYSSLSKLFSKEVGQTLEHYYILLRIERVKELLDYDELKVSEIAHKVGYSSVH